MLKLTDTKDLSGGISSYLRWDRNDHRNVQLTRPLTEGGSPQEHWQPPDLPLRFINQFRDVRKMPI